MRKRLALINLGVALTMVASFMALSGSSVAAKPIHAAKVIHLTVDGYASTKAEPADLQKVINDFEAKNKDIQVTLAEPGNYDTSVLAAISSRSGSPDLFYVDSSVFDTWANAKALYPLNTFIKNDPSYDYSQMYPGLRAGYTVHGKIYGVAKDYSTLALYINVSIWNSAMGAKAKAPTTWNQFASDACKISTYEKKHGHPDVVGAADMHDQARWNPLLQSDGGSVLNKSWTKATIDSKAGIEAINQWADLIKKGCAAWPTSSQGNWGGGAFEAGAAAMTWEGPWLLPGLQTTYTNIRYRVVPLPVHGNYLYNVAYSINPYSKNKAAAWKLLSYLTGKVGEQKWVNLFQVLPARRGLKPPPGDGAFLKGAKYAIVYNFPAGYCCQAGTPYSTLNDDIQAVGDGQMTAKAAVKDVTNAINPWLHP